MTGVPHPPLSLVMVSNSHIDIDLFKDKGNTCSEESFFFNSNLLF